MSTTGLPYYFICGCIRIAGSVDEPLLQRAISLGTRKLGAAANLPIFPQHQTSVLIIDLTTSSQPQKEAELWIEARYSQSFEPAFSMPLEVALIRLNSNECLVFVRSHRSLLNDKQLVTFLTSLGKIYREVLAETELQLTHSAHQLNSSNDSPGNSYSSVNKAAGSAGPIMVGRGNEKDEYQFLARCQLRLMPHQRVLLEEIQVGFNVPLDALALAASLVYAEKLEQGAIDPQQGGGENDNINPAVKSPKQQLLYPGATIENLVKGIARPIDKNASSLQFKPGQYGSASEFHQNTTLDFGHLIQADFHSLSQETEMLAPEFCWFERAEDNELSLNLRLSQHTAATELARLLLRRLLFIAEQLNPAVCTLVNDIKIIPPCELKLLDGFSHSSIEYPRSKTIVDLFESLTVDTPGAEALVFEEDRLSYAELNSRSNQLAHFLIGNGVVTGELVPICMERSPEMIIAILAVLKAGAAYVPIDPGYPADRIKYVLQDTGAKLLLSNTDMTRLDAGPSIELIQPLEREDDIKGCSTWNPERKVSPSDLVYVLYTSGSTGRPKGVMIEHRALLDHCFGLIQAADLQECKSFALFSPLVFDAGHAIIHTSFILGATLHVLSSRLLANGESLRAYFESETIDCLKIVPSLWLTYAAEEQVILARKVMIFGGEPFAAKIKSHISEYAGEVFNHYGPTETTIGKTISRVDLKQGDEQIPIGSPFSNTSIYIVDNQNYIVPVGIAGELLIGGEGLARGYLNLPELTHEKFIPDNFSRLASARLYRSGDLAKWLPTGEIVYLGRRDEQVKIRGHRIEIGEIESVIQQSKYVQQSTVLAITAENVATRLVAIVVPAAVFSQDALESYLEERLPAYMLPTQWVELEKMPLTVNGKLDRKKLLEMSIAIAKEKGYQVPSTPTETLLSEIWQRLFGLVRIGRNDNFWELGGHSLLAMRLVSAVRKQLGIEFDIKHLFQYDTVQTLAGFLDTQVSSFIIEPVKFVGEFSKSILSFGQQRLWFIHQSRGSEQYHLPFAWNLIGNINKTSLEIAFQIIIDRHHPLRTVIKGNEGDGVPELLPANNWLLTELNWSHHAKDEIEDLLRNLIRRPFDLSRDFMLRAHLIQTSVTEHILLVTIHHIASDGWSTTIWIRELSEIYTSLQQKWEVILPVAGISYQDYARWQYGQTKSTAWQKKLDYWAAQLTEVPNLQLPTEPNAKPHVNSEGDTVTHEIGLELTRQLQALSLQRGATLFMTVLAAFNVLLYRYTSQENFCIGTPTAGRQQEELEHLVGYFVNTLALRASLNRSMSFEELLSQVKTTTLDAYEHQDVPFEKVVQLVVPEREEGVSPLFQVMLVLQNTPQLDKLHLDGLQVHQDISPSTLHTHAQFPLTFVLTQGARGLQLVVEYQSGLFSSATIRRMVANYGRLLESIVADPTQLVGALPLVSKLEEFRLLHEFNGPTRGDVAGSTILNLFHGQVKANPTNAAVIFDAAELSYKELDERTNQLANFLVKQGLKDQLVPICVERSFNMLVGILAILKAGSAYVPVDPTYSPERIAYILQDCAAPALLVSSHTRPILPPGGKAKIISVDTDWPVISLESTDLNETTAPDPESLAYVIYTSGSTGKPKGTMLQHRSLFASVQTRINYYGPIGKVFLVPSVAFDSSVAVIFGTLASGDMLVLCRDEDVKEPAVLSTILPTLDGLLCVPSYYRFLLESGLLRDANLSTVILGGEVVDENLVANHYAQTRPAKLYNEYGPTEAGVWATVTAMEPASLPTIGKPINSVQVYILDTAGALLPQGIVGELCIGGVQVAQGYLNLPGLTAEKFIPDPFNGNPGAKMYRTGDIGRWLPDGDIEYLGRNDEQVKIRGYRIELNGIERVLQEFHGVEQAVVMARERTGSDKHLVAYVVGKGRIETGEATKFLRERLPEYMVPATWVMLEKFPLNQNGKIDRRKLPAPGSSSPIERAFVAPRTTLESKLVATWKKFLAVEQLSIHDNFFAIGGHSLLAMRLVSATRKGLGLEISVKQFFNHPTVAKQAALMEEQTQTTQQSCITTGARPVKLPLSFNQESLWFIDRVAGSVHYHIPAVYELTGKLNVEMLERALQSIVERHEILRTVIREEAGEAFQYVPDQRAWTMSRTSDPTFANNPEMLRAFLRREHARPFNLARDPMLRAVLVDLGGDRSVLLITVHHIASDGWSASVIETELRAFYTSFLNDQPPALNPLPLQYADYALWQRSQLQQAGAQQHLEYWKNKLAGANPLQLPLDYPRPLVQSTNGAILDLHIDVDLSQRLQSLANEQGVTLFMVLQSVLAVLLHRHSCQEDICIGIPVAGREQEEVADMVGFFVNTLTLRTQVAAGERFVDLLEQVKTTTLEAYDHQQVPFEHVVKATVKDRDPGRSPLFQVMLVLQQLPGTPSFHLGEAKATHLEPGLGGHTTSKFDLTFNLMQGEDGLHCALEYCTGLFREETIQRLLLHFNELLSAVATNPEEKVGLLTMLTQPELNYLLNQFGDRVSNYPADKNIIDCFAEQVKANPANPALVFGEEQLTYEQLNLRTNQLAQFLHKQGVQPGDMVPVFMGRSMHLIVACLAILKTGAVYVPVDPKYPQERIGFMLEDISANIVLASEESLAGFTVDQPAPVLLIDKEWESISQETGEDLIAAVLPNSHAYVMYTSGSTGKPKGVLVTHQNVVSLVKEIDYVSLDAGRILLSTGSASFDATTFEYWGMLLNGGTLVLCPDSVLLDPALLKAAITRQRVTLMWFTSSWFNQLVDTDPGLFAPLETIMVGGEKLSELHVKKLKQQFPKLQIINGYGPTENTTFSLAYTIPEEPGATSIPIGKPLNNRTAYILDEYLQPVPVGVSGEIYLGGAGLAVGYLNRAELTTEKFISHPFSDNPGARLYRTGDLGRWLPGGNIEFLGRNDEQVKIRGFRVELGELENVLQQSGLVTEAVVRATTDYSGSQQLVAYVVAPGIFFRDEMVTYLQGKLPDYFIPATWVSLKALPLTANGKVDKKALPLPFLTEAISKQGVAPRNGLEEKLAATWQELLNIPRPGIHDNFFELGGHSLGAIRLAALIRSGMNVEVSINELFIYPTIAGLAAHLENKSEHASPIGQDRCLVPLRKTGNKTPLYIMAGGGGTALRFKPFVELLDEEQPVYALQSPMNQHTLAGFPTTIEGMAERFIEEILEQNPHGPYALSGHCVGGMIAFEMAKRMQSMGRKVEFLFMFDSILPIPKKVQTGLRERLLNLPYMIADLAHKFIFKLEFEFFLLARHPKHAFNYKRRAIGTLIDKNKRRFSGAAAPTLEGLEIMNASADVYLAAKDRYALTPYKGQVVAFYVKERFFFTDVEKKIKFRRIHLSEQVKNNWRNYATNVTLHETEGDHSSMFETENGKELAELVQQYLDKPPSNDPASE